MKVTFHGRNVSLGGIDFIEVRDTVAANDDITISRRGDGEVSIAREDVPKLIAALEAHLKVGQDGEW